MSAEQAALCAVPQPAPSPAPNRRVAVRYPCRSGTTGKCMLAGEYISRGARVLDISTGGVALQLSKRLRRRTQLLLQLYNADLCFHYTVAVHVAHVTALPRGKWLIGCTFGEELSQQDVESLARTAEQ